MGLTVVTGRANAGKTGVIYGAVLDAAASGRHPALVLPTRPDVARATAELSRRATVGIRIDVLDAWIAELWSLHGDGRVPVRPEQRALLVSDAVAGARLHALERSARAPGFNRMVCAVARRVAEEPRESLDAPRALSATDRELRGILHAYRSALHAAGLIEPAEAARALAAAPPAVEGPVLVHRFSDLSASQESLLIALAREQEVWVSLLWEEGFPATEATSALVGRLIAAGSHRHLPVADADGDRELARLEASLFARPAPQASGGAVRFCTATGREAEAALIASEAARAAARFGADRVAVVLRSDTGQAEGIRRALRGAGVPSDTDVLVPLLRTPMGSAIAHLLQAVVGGEDRERLLAFLRTPFSGAAREAVDELDARWRGDLRTDRGFTRADGALVGSAATRPIDCARRLAGRPSLKDWQILAGAMLGNAHGAPSAQADPDSAVDAAAHRAILEAVSGMWALRREGVDAATALGVFADVRVPAAAAERPGHLQVTEAHRLRGRRFDAVIVAGLTAGEYSSEGRSSPGAQRACRLVGADPDNEQARERLLYYSVCTRARRLLVLTRRTAGADGEPERPSVFWEETLDLYRAPGPDAGHEAEEALVSAHVRIADLERAAPALSEGRAGLRARASAANPSLPQRPGRLTDPDTLDWLSGRDEFSATELETYARCPYRWFYERAVRPERLDTAFDALARGDLAHRALAILYGELLERLGERRVTPANLGTALALADEAFDRALGSSSTPRARTLLEEDDQARVGMKVRSLISADAHFLPGFVPGHVELRFGDPASPVDLGGFRLRGCIDRVDESDDGIAVIDYKTGAVPTLAGIGRDRRIQVPLYAAAARALLGRPVLAGLYRSLRDGEARGFHRAGAAGLGSLVSTDGVDSAEEIDAIVASAVETARSAADGIRAGAIPAQPCSAEACGYCAASAFCGRGA